MYVTIRGLTRQPSDVSLRAYVSPMDGKLLIIPMAMID